MPTVVKVSRAQVLAAQLRVKSDLERGLTPDPRMVKIANARTVRSSEGATHVEVAPADPVEEKLSSVRETIAEVQDLWRQEHSDRGGEKAGQA